MPYNWAIAYPVEAGDGAGQLHTSGGIGGCATLTEQGSASGRGWPRTLIVAPNLWHHTQTPRHPHSAPNSGAVPIFDGQLAAIMAEVEGADPEDYQFQVCTAFFVLHSFGKLGSAGHQQVSVCDLRCVHECVHVRAGLGRHQRQAAWGHFNHSFGGRLVCPLWLPTAAPPHRATPLFHVQSRIYNLRETKVIRDLNPSDINKLISVSGMVTRTSGVIPDQRCVFQAQIVCVCVCVKQWLYGCGSAGWGGVGWW